MDQASFNVSIEIIGADIDLFLQVLKDSGFVHQASIVEEQINKQIKES